MSPRTRRVGVVTALLTACSGLVLLATPAHADPPANDDLAQAAPLALDQPVTTDPADATLETDPAESTPCGGRVERTVWFELTVDTDQRVVVQTLLPRGVVTGSTTLVVWRGPADATRRDLLVGACGLTNGGTRQARATVDATAGTHYYVQVGTTGAPGPFDVAAWTTPDNDDRADATALTGDTGSLPNESLRGATIERREPANFGDRSVWYRWAAPATGYYRFDTAPVGANGVTTNLHAYIDNPLAEELRELPTAATDVPSPRRPARVGFLAAEGQDYLFAVRSSAASQAEDFALTWTPYEPHETRLSVTADVLQPGEVKLSAEVERIDGSQAPEGQVRVLENGYVLDSADLVDGSATVVLERVRGVHTYTVNFVRSTLDDVPSTQQVTVDAGRSPGTPANDDLTDAIAISGSSGASTGATLVGGTREGGEPLFSAEQRGQTVWWRWTAPTTDTFEFTLETAGDDMGADPTRQLFLLGVRGDARGGPRTLRDASISLDPGADRSTLEVPGVAGRTYYLVADLLGDSSSIVPDDLTLQWEATGADPGPAVSLTAESTGPYEVALTAELADEDTNAYVYFYEGERVIGFLQGNSPSGLTLYDRGHEPGDTTYHVEVYPFDGSTGPGSSADVPFIVPTPEVPGNDRFADAVELEGAGGSTSGTTVGASADAGAAVGDLGYPTADRTVWYRWVAPADGAAAFRLDRTDRRGDPVLRLYEDADDDATGPADLDLVAVNDDVLNTGAARSEVRFPAVGGRTYYVAVDAYSLGTTGSWNLGWRPLSPAGTSTLGVTSTVDGRDVVLDTAASAPGRVLVREGDELVAVAAVRAGDGSVRLTDVAPGDHAYSVVLLPDDVGVATSSATATATVVAQTRTTVTGPRRAAAGDRPTVRVTVRAVDAARSVLSGGSVRIALGKRVLATRRVVDGRASLRLPALRAGRAVVRVTYLGSDFAARSTGTRTIVVRR